MAVQKNMQIKLFNGLDWDTYFPKTLASITMRGDGTSVETVLTNLLNDLAQKVEQTDINAAIANLVNSSPATLDTLNELASALDDDPNFATTITTQLGSKVDKIAGKALSSNDFTTTLLNRLNALKYIEVGITEPTNKGLWFEEI